jgi:division protein CdvB (Snf7/Vps24/ESCRT-III family)
MNDTIKKVMVENPFRQREYLKLMKERITELKDLGFNLTPLGREKKIKELDQMIDVLIDDNSTIMNDQLPEKYYAIIGGCSRLQIGVCVDPDDVWYEEPEASVREISKEEFDAYGE